jgi:hypothetical protein
MTDNKIEFSAMLNTIPVSSGSDDEAEDVTNPASIENGSGF